jgi:hypothetical protein
VELENRRGANGEDWVGDMIQGRLWSVIMAVVVRSLAALLQGRKKTSGIMTTAEHEKHVHKHTKTYQYNPPSPVSPRTTRPVACYPAS